jgi:hypothetical protein
LVFGARESDLQRRVQNQRDWLKKRDPKDFLLILKARALDDLAQDYKEQLLLGADIDNGFNKEDEYNSSNKTNTNKLLPTERNMARRGDVLPGRFRKYFFMLFILLQAGHSPPCLLFSCSARC